MYFYKVCFMLNVSRSFVVKLIVPFILATSSGTVFSASSLNFTPKLIAPVNEHSKKSVKEREKARDYSLAFYYYADGKNKNLKKAKFWVEQGIKKNDKDSYFLLGMMHLKGDAAPKNSILAIDNLKEAAELNHKQANEMLGLIYYYGVDVPIDFDEVFMYLSEVGDVASPESKTILGKLYYNGDGTDKDYEKAFKYISEAAQANYPEAQAMLSILYRKGQGVNVDLDKSHEWLRKAANKNLEARLLMGMNYERGEYGKPDYKEAYHYYSWARDMAFPDKSKVPADSKSQKLLNNLMKKMSKDEISKAEVYSKARRQMKMD